MPSHPSSAGRICRRRPRSQTLPTLTLSASLQIHSLNGREGYHRVPGPAVDIGSVHRACALDRRPARTALILLCFDDVTFADATSRVLGRVRRRRGAADVYKHFGAAHRLSSLLERWRRCSWPCTRVRPCAARTLSRRGERARAQGARQERRHRAEWYAPEQMSRTHAPSPCAS
jgi:hypothetical protein